MVKSVGDGASQSPMNASIKAESDSDGKPLLLLCNLYLYNLYLCIYLLSE